MNLGLHIDQGYFFAIPQSTYLAKNELIILLSTNGCKAIRSDPDPNRIESKKIASQQMRYL